MPAGGFANVSGNAMTDTSFGAQQLGSSPSGLPASPGMPTVSPVLHRAWANFAACLQEKSGPVSESSRPWSDGSHTGLMRPLRSGISPVLLCCVTSLLACPESGTPTDPPQPRLSCDAEGNLVQKSPVPPIFCYDNQTYGLDDTRLDQCYFRGERPVCAPRWSSGDPTPAGPYACTCNVPRSRNYAFLAKSAEIADAGDCESALETACPFDPQEPAACDRPALGVCGPVRGELGRWSCQCEGSEELHDVFGESCVTALGLACAAP